MSFSVFARSIAAYFIQEAWNKQRGEEKKKRCSGVPVHFINGLGFQQEMACPFSGEGEKRWRE